MGSAEARYLELSEAIWELSDRCLYHPMRWASEQLIGLPAEVIDQGASKAAEERRKRIQPEHPMMIIARSYFQHKVISDSIMYGNHL